MLICLSKKLRLRERVTLDEAQRGHTRDTLSSRIQLLHELGEICAEIV
jgi:hypothetical protein